MLSLKTADGRMLGATKPVTLDVEELLNGRLHVLVWCWHLCFFISFFVNVVIQVDVIINAQCFFGESKVFVLHYAS